VGFLNYERLTGIPETRFHIKNRGLRFGRVGLLAVLREHTLFPGTGGSAERFL
jgi:hypothetical protein